MRKALQCSLPLLFLPLVACRTLDPQAEKVTLLDRPPENCKKLGTVNLDWAWRGTSSERLNVLRNQTAELGGNAVLLLASSIGTAYNCPRDKMN